MRQGQTIFFTIFIFLLLVLPARAQTSLSDLKPAHIKALNAWLKANSGWQLALEKDYGEENLSRFRQGTTANARPFYAAKDFNGDRQEDFAVILTNGSKYAVAIFNAPFAAPKPAFYTDEIEAGDIAYYNPNTKKLIIGPFGSDAGFQMIPSGKTYKIKFF